MLVGYHHAARLQQMAAQHADPARPAYLI
eukprot:COSAG06_NODE_30600_length_535_cov_3472.791284_1_plen_28_part_10